MWGLGSLVVLTILAVTVGTLDSHSQQKTLPTPSGREGKDPGDQKALYPIVDFAVAVPDADSEARKARGVYFNGSRDFRITEDRRIKFITYAESWVESLRAIPIEQSSIILSGTVTASYSFLSKDQTDIYSEFQIKVSELVRTDNGIGITPEQLISVNRVGGRVRFPSGHIQSYELSGAGALEVGEKYIVFLKREDSVRGFLLVTAYKIKNEKVFPIDDTVGVGAYKGLSLSEFLKEIEKASRALQSKEEPGKRHICRKGY